jgi:NitT/TauT family transport system ATP-binding protein
VVLVTHDVDEALIMADKVHVLTGRPASVRETVVVPFERPRKPTEPGMVELREQLVTTLERGAGNGA